MNTISRIVTLALALSPLTALAYQKAENMEEAKSKAGVEGIVIATYADGWDKHSRKTMERMLEAEAVKKALGKAVVMQLGVPNVSSKEENEKNQARFGKIDLSFPNSYPAFLFYDKEGYRVADLCISFDERKKPKAVAKRITEILEASARQQDLLARSESASGVEKARLLGQASAIPGLKKPNNVAKRIQQADPDDKAGMYKIATLNLHATAIESASTKDWKATLKEMKDMMKNPLLTTEHQQQLCCICIGLLHRHGGVSHKAELEEMIDKLQKLDPDSLLGKSATDARRLWVKNLTLAEGWNPDVIPADQTPVEVMGDIPIKAAGTYTVTFSYKRGNHAAFFSAVELYDGKKKVAEDRHDGSAGHNSRNNVYTLNVPATVKKPRLMVTFNMEKNRNSFGSITVSAK